MSLFLGVFSVKKLERLSGKGKEKTLREMRNKEGGGIHIRGKQKGAFADGENRTSWEDIVGRGNMGPKYTDS